MGLLSSQDPSAAALPGKRHDRLSALPFPWQRGCAERRTPGGVQCSEIQQPLIVYMVMREVGWGGVNEPVFRTGSILGDGEGHSLADRQHLITSLEQAKEQTTEIISAESSCKDEALPRLLL